MIDERTIVEHAVERLTPPEPSFERLLRRRERKVRNKRIAAGVVAIAVLLIPVWLVTAGGRVDRTLTPATTGSPVAPVPTDLGNGMGFQGLAPEGATPSTPAHGHLVFSFEFGHTYGDAGRFSLSMYADGRVIWQRLGTTRGLIEQRLTPEGVGLVLAEARSTGFFDHDRWFAGTGNLFYGGVSIRSGEKLVRLAWGHAGFEVGIDSAATTPTPEEVLTLERLDARLEDLISWLPASAWEDAELKAYVPSRYSICYMYMADGPLDRLGVLDLLPARAADMLRPLELAQSYPNGFRESAPYWCTVSVSTEQARTLAAIMKDAGAPVPPDGSYAFPLGVSVDLVDIGIGPALPDE